MLNSESYTNKYMPIAASKTPHGIVKLVFYCIQQTYFENFPNVRKYVI